MKRLWNKNDFIDAVKVSKSIAQVIRTLGVKNCGGNYQTIKKDIARYEIDISHFTGQGHLKGKSHNWTNATPIEQLLVENRYAHQSHMKKRILREGILEYKCQVCRMSPEWLGKKLVLVLDHISGDTKDWRKENLRFLCPNCNSQTETFSRSRTLLKKKEYKCLGCNKDISRSTRSGFCVACSRIYKNKRP